MISSYRDNIVNTLGLVAYWRLADTSGTTALAAVGPNGTYGNTPTLGAQGTLSGDPNPSVSFTRASAEHISVSGMPAGTDRGVTLSCAVTPDTYAVNEDHTLVNWGFINDGAVGCSWWEYYSGTNSLIYHYADGALRAIAQAWPTTVGTTYHFAGVHDYGAKAFHLYSNGALVGTTSLSGHGTPVPIAASATTYIATYNGTLYPWNGVMDEIALFNRPLTGTEVSRIARLGRGF